MSPTEALVARTFPTTYFWLTQPPFDAVDWDRLPIGFLIDCEEAETGETRDAILRRVEKPLIDAGMARFARLWEATE